MAFTATDLTNLETAMSEIVVRGAVEVEINGRRVKYLSLDALKEAYKFVQQQVLNANDGPSAAVRFDLPSG